MQRLKALAGLLLAPVALPLAEFGAALLPCTRHALLRDRAYAALVADLAVLLGR